jgi:hypothetical protein
MGLHEDIKEACRGAAKIVGGSALGYEWAIHDLPRVVADIVVVLLRDDRLRDELRRRGIHVLVDDIRPRKFA